MIKFNKPKLAQVNLFLAIVIVGINLYVFTAPLVPQLNLWLRKWRSKTVAGLPYQTHLDNTPNSKRAPKPADDRLVVPKIALNEHIYEGTSPYLVNKGVWARPKTSTPPKGSNTVLVGHRFTYDGPATFYSLDKVKIGDPIVVYWQSKEYDYTISVIKVVPPTAVEIEKASADPELTIYTCTPLWSAKDRLVVIAKLNNEGHSNE